MIAPTPEPPYYAVIFTSIRTKREPEAYAAAADRMLELAREQPGFLGEESAREHLGITVSYWASLDAIAAWKRHAEHVVVQAYGRLGWYAAFKTRIAKVERDYGFEWSEES
jgi:heme-degrading monooxygenase HmoA